MIEFADCGWQAGCASRSHRLWARRGLRPKSCQLQASRHEPPNLSMHQSLLLASVERFVAWSWTIGRKQYQNAVWQPWTSGFQQTMAAPCASCQVYRMSQLADQLAVIGSMPSWCRAAQAVLRGLYSTSLDGLHRASWSLPVLGQADKHAAGCVCSGESSRLLCAANITGQHGSVMLSLS